MKFGVGMSTEPAVSAVVGGGVQFEYTVLGGEASFLLSVNNLYLIYHLQTVEKLPKDYRI
jgi:hypothetical protein